MPCAPASNLEVVLKHVLAPRRKEEGGAEVKSSISLASMLPNMLPPNAGYPKHHFVPIVSRTKLFYYTWSQAAKIIRLPSPTTSRSQELDFAQAPHSPWSSPPSYISWVYNS